MYKIGEFSKIVNIPVRTLRFYDMIGLLEPNEVDQFTNYRYYDEQNINECEKIKLLKSLEFSLKEIIQYKDSLNEIIIDKKRQEIKDKISLLKLKDKRLLILKEEINTPILKRKSIKKNDEIKILRRN